MAWVMLQDCLVFTVAVGAYAAPWLAVLAARPVTERFAVAIGLGLLAGFLVLFAAYAAGFTFGWLWVGAAGSIAIASARRRMLRAAAWEGTGALLGRWLALAAWGLGWHALVASYSGAAWSGDWAEHYERARFFLERWPLDHQFIGVYELPARPPLANVWIAGALAVTGPEFFHFQSFATLFSTLVFLPLAALVQRWNPHPRAQDWLLLVLMSSPLVVQNATFPWTKLPAAYFVLAAALEFTAATRERLQLIRGAALLGAGMLAHFSAGPWIVALGGYWLWRHRAVGPATLARTALPALALGFGVLTVWFAWSTAHYGAATTFTGNTAVALAPGGGIGERLLRAGANLGHTLNPLGWGERDIPLLAQASMWGKMRDQFFLLYQLKLPYAFGLGGAAVLAWLISKRWRARGSGAWAVAIILALVLATGTHAAPDRLGLVHISLQPLALLGLAWIAAHLEEFPPWLRHAWCLGAACDTAAGIALHFATQSLWLDRWVTPGRSAREYLAHYPWPAQGNLVLKEQLGATFLADVIPSSSAVILLLLAAAWALAAWPVRGAGGSSCGQEDGLV